MSLFSDTQGVSTHGVATAQPAEAAQPRRDGFWAQTPAAALAIAAVVAIVFVNGPDRQAPAKAQPTVATAAAAGPASEKAAATPLPTDCPDCAVVLSVQQLHGTGDSGFALEVRMRDGTRRTIRQFAAGFDVGDVVLVNGNALTLRQP